MTDPSVDPTHSAADHTQHTRAITSGRKGSQGSLAPVLWNSTTFECADIVEARSMATSARPERFYGRYGNPTVAAFEDAIAELEGVESARAFGSGMGAISAVVFALCSTGGHIVAAQDIYGGPASYWRDRAPDSGST